MSQNKLFGIIIWHLCPCTVIFRRCSSSVVIILSLRCGKKLRMKLTLKYLPFNLYRLITSLQCVPHWEDAASDLHTAVLLRERSTPKRSPSACAPSLVLACLHSGLHFPPQTINPAVSVALFTSRRAFVSWQIHQSPSSSWHGCGSPCCFIILRNFKPTDFVSLTFLSQWLMDEEGKLGW